MIYGNIDPAIIGPNKPINGPGGGFSRVFKEVAIKAGQDTKAAAEQATVNAIKKLAQVKTPGNAVMPDVSVSAPSSSLSAKWSALPTWVKWTAFAVGALAVMKAAAPSGD